MKALLLCLIMLSPGCTREAGSSRSVLRIFAASSLTEAFVDLGRRFEARHPAVDVRLTFAGSQVLRLQLEQGAVADLFASANQQHMAALVASGVVSSSTIFASNELVIVVPSDNPAAIKSFADLPRAARLVIGADNVPVGIYSQRLLDRASARYGHGFVALVRSRVVSKESNVRIVRAKVELGEADAAIVYRTDGAAADRVRVIAIPPTLNVRATYPIGPIATSVNPELAVLFLDYVTSVAGREVLERHGFVTVR